LAINTLRLSATISVALFAVAAHAVVLTPGVWTALPGTAGPGGTAIEDDVVSFSFAAYAGTVSGSVQNRVVQRGDGTLVFYWRVFNDANSAGPIQDFRLGNFILPLYDADWSNTGLGDVGPNDALLFNGSGGFVNFNFNTIGAGDGLLPGQSSKFFFIDSSFTQYARTAAYDLTNIGQTDNSDVYSTFAPVPEPATVLALALGAGALLARRRRSK
jgi:hypothetical protein